MKITSLDIPSSVESLAQMKEELPEGVAITDLLTGLKSWRNPVNRFFVMRLHRSADPRKRTQEWVDKTRAGLSTADWLREYELIWEALEGKPVYADEWSAEFHSSRTSLGWNPTLTVCRGWDFGLYPACVFAQLFPYNRLIVLREMVGVDIDTERFCDEVSRLSTEWFPGARFIEFIDPTGRNRAGTDGRAYTNILSKKPLKCKRIYPGLNAPAARHAAVVEFLKGNVKGLPCLLVDPSCEMLIKGFNGGYFYSYLNGTLKPKPEKNIFSHIHDGLQYLCSKILTVNVNISTASFVVTEPRYGGRDLPTAMRIEA